jgi:glycosyltransferase involved in cell wall biosynthesis
VSRDLHEQCLATGVSRQRCVLLENGIDTRQYTRTLDRATAKVQLGLGPNRFLIGAIGRLSAEKGFDVLVRAVHLSRSRGVDVALMIVGEGGQRRELEELANRLELRDRVHLMGYHADAARFFEAMDVFALASVREGLPNTLLEAMAMSVPVVATRVGGVATVIQHDHDGLLVEPGDERLLADALDRLRSDAALRDRLAAAGRSTVEERYSFAARMEKLARIYDDLMADDGS